MSKLRLGVAALALVYGIGMACAQTTTQTPSGNATSPATEDRTNVKTDTPPLSGANSFTESQARDRINAAGFQDVKDLKKDDQGVWRAVAKKGDTQVNVALDYRGNVVQE